MISSSKWSLHKFFSKSPHIRPYLPPTTLYQPASLDSYLDKYDTVYIKPTRTHMGKGIVRVWKTGSGYQFVKERGQCSLRLVAIKSRRTQESAGSGAQPDSDQLPDFLPL